MNIIRVHGLAFDGLVDDISMYILPQWIENYDVDARGGRGEVNLTTDRAKAMTFPDPGAAMSAWRTQSTVTPLRPDGKPNRPLTAYTVEIEPL